MEENTLGIALVDVGNGFKIYDERRQYKMPYGTFSLSLINLDFNKIRKNIIDILKQYFGNGFNPSDTERFAEKLKNNVGRYILGSSKGYLRTEQANKVTELLVAEILGRIQTENFEISDINSCMPILFSKNDLQDKIRNILTRNALTLRTIIRSMGVHEIDSKLIFVDNSQWVVYYLKDIYDYLLLDLQKYIEMSDRTGKAVKKCKCCGRLFVPSRKSDKYCRLPNLEFKSKTCNEIMKVSPQDEFVKMRNKARDKQYKKAFDEKNIETYDAEFLSNLYFDWSQKCKKAFLEYKGKNDLQGFQNWIAETRFIKPILEQKWKEYQE